MAKIGLRNFLFGILTEASDGTATYGAATKPGKAISCSVSIENNDAKLDADDAVAETDTSFQSGTVTLGIDDEDLATMATLLGHEITDGNLVRNANDAAPYVGLGRVVTKMVGGVYKYKVEFLCKVKFSEPSQEDNTKSSDGVEFGTSEIEGQIATLADGNWSIAQTFDTMTEAQTYLNSLFGTAESE
jgi:phi13 family phage major tail protein